jgi:hypothetical protein
MRLNHAVFTSKPFLLLLHPHFPLEVLLLFLLKLSELSNGLSLLQLLEKIALSIDSVFLKLFICDVLVAVRALLCLASAIIHVLDQLVSRDT